MPTPTTLQGYGFGLVYLHTTPAAGPSPNLIAVTVWNRSHDHPLAAQRSSLITGIELVALGPDGSTPSTGPQFTLQSLVDGGNIDVKSLFVPSFSAGIFGLTGYKENDLAGAGGYNVVWAEYAGVVDERTVADINSDKLLPRSRVSDHGSLTAYNQVRGPLTVTWSAPSIPAQLGVNLQFQFIGNSEPVAMSSRYSFGL